MHRMRSCKISNTFDKIVARNKAQVIVIEIDAYIIKHDAQRAALINKNILIFIVIAA